MRARILDLHPGTVKKLLRLKKEAESDGVYRVARRIHAVLLNHDRYTSGEITTLLKAARARVSEWLKNYEQYGYEGLLEGYRPGRTPVMTPAEECEGLWLRRCTHRQIPVSAGCRVQCHDVPDFP